MTTLFFLVLNLCLAAPALAQPEANHAAHHGDANMSAATPADLSEGEVRRIDKTNAKVTIKHGPLRNLGMPPMTMVFRVKDPAMLDQIKEGDRVKFVADRIDGVFTLTQVERVH